MAVYHLQASNNISTVGAFKRSEYYKINFANYAYYYAVTTSYTYFPLTFANNGNQQEIVLYTARRGTTGTFSITLEEYVGAVWTTRTTDTFNMSAVENGYGMQTFALTSYAVTSAASTWRYGFKTSSSGMLTLGCEDGSAVTNLMCSVALDTDTTSVPTTGDAVIIKNSTTLTLDQSITLGTASGSPTQSIYFGTNATLAVTSPAASYTLTLRRPILFSSNGHFNIGSSGARISNANRFIIDTTHANFTTGIVSLLLNATANQYASANTEQTATISWYGATDNYIAGTAASLAAASQKDIVLTADLSAIWNVGDTIQIVGKNSTVNNGDTASYTIASFSGTTVTLNANLDYPVFAGARIVNMDRGTEALGIEWKGTQTPLWYQDQIRYDRFIFSGVYCNQTSLSYRVSYNYTTGEVSNTNTGNLYESILHVGQGGTRNFIGNGVNNNVISNVHCIQTALNWGNSCLTLYGTGNSITNFSAKNYFNPASTIGNIGILGANAVISNMTFFHTYNSSGVSAYLPLVMTSANHTVSDSMFGVSGGSYINCSNSTFTNCKFDAGLHSNLILATGIGNIFTNCSLGANDTAVTYDVQIASGAFAQAAFRNCTIGATGVGALTTTNAVPGSYMLFDTYNATTNDHRGWYYYGKHVSAGTGLTDTTVDSLSGTLTFRIEPLSSTTSHTWVYKVPTGNLQNKRLLLGIRLKINSATYYAGTHQLPRLTANYDNGTTAYVQAAQNTDWQTLFLPLQPATAYGQIVCTISARTDATTTNAYVYVSKRFIIYPTDTPINLENTDLWADGLPVDPPIAVPLTAFTVSNAVWEELLANHITSATYGKIVKNTKLIPPLLGKT